MKLTRQFCTKLRPEDGRLHWDDSLPAFGLRVGKTKKSWVVRLKDKHRDTIMTLGAFQDLAPHDARRMAVRELEHRRRAGGSTLKAFSDQWIQRSRVGARTRANYVAHLKIICEHLGRRALRDLRRPDVVRFREDLLAKGHGTTNTNRILACLSSCLSYALELGEVDYNACIGVRRLPERPRERRLQAEELGRVVRAIREEPNVFYRAYWQIILLTGCRPGEARQMRWDQVDLDAGQWMLQETKNHRPHLVPLSATAVKVLRELPQMSEVVFCARRDPKKPISGSGKLWTAMCARAKVQNLHMHDLRRSAASLLVDQGKGLKYIGGLLNHQSQATTEIYARLGSPALREAVEIIENQVNQAAAEKEES